MQEAITVWIEQANNDLNAAKYNLEGKQLSVVVLLVQQSVEKALKALFLKMAGEIPKVHDLVFLAKKLKLPEKLYQYCKQISPFYMQTRYPDAKGFKRLSEFSFDECEQSVKNAEEILAWIEKEL